ncbi:MAG: tRNA pseudouridine(55) synthase TruB [Gammaproteobacteria bacterium]
MVARRRKGRKVDGILLLDKPAGISSNQALQKVKRLFQAQKAGHTGNLDGPATGLLPVCFGEATKMTTYLLDSDKSYTATIKLGINTTTLDAEGDVIKTRPVPKFSAEDLQEILQQFRGDIIQIPPMYSALKHDGERLYKLAQKGKEVERKERQQKIYRLEASRLTGNGFTIEVDCSKGTYIRTLAEDIGEVLGCGAHVLSLKRTKVGCFDLDDSYTIELIEKGVELSEEIDNLLLPVDEGLKDLPICNLSNETAFYFLNGQSVVASCKEKSGLTRVYRASEQFLGIAEIMMDGRIAPKRLIATGADQ